MHLWLHQLQKKQEIKVVKVTDGSREASDCPLPASGPLPPSSGSDILGRGTPGPIEKTKGHKKVNSKSHEATSQTATRQVCGQNLALSPASSPILSAARTFHFRFSFPRPLLESFPSLARSHQVRVGEGVCVRKMKGVFCV